MTIYQGFLEDSNIWNVVDDGADPLDSMGIVFTSVTPAQLTATASTAYNSVFLKIVVQGSFSFASNFELGKSTFEGMSGSATAHLIYLARTSAPTNWQLLETVEGYALDLGFFGNKPAFGFTPEINSLMWNGNDVFSSHSGSREPDAIAGYGGNDTFRGYGDNNPGTALSNYTDSDFFDGGIGVDTAIFRGKAAEYQIIDNGRIWDRISETTPNFFDGIRVIDSVKNRDGTDDLVNVERLKFVDKTRALDFSPGENSYKAAMFVGAAFGGDSLGQYFAPAVYLIDSGLTLSQISQLVIDLELIESNAGITNRDFVRHVYENVVGTPPDSFSEALYVSYLNQGVFTKAGLLELASTVPMLEAQINLVGLQTNGIEYLPFL